MARHGDTAFPPVSWCAVQQQTEHTQRLAQRFRLPHGGGLSARTSCGRHQGACGIRQPRCIRLQRKGGQGRKGGAVCGEPYTQQYNSADTETEGAREQPP